MSFSLQTTRPGLSSSAASTRTYILPAERDRRAVEGDAERAEQTEMQVYAPPVA